MTYDKVRRRDKRKIRRQVLADTVAVVSECDVMHGDISPYSINAQPKS